MKSFYTCLFLLLISISYSQDIILKGKILDENKSPLPGANVYFEGTTIGTITDVNGYFELKLVSDINSILVISYIGYEDIFINDHSVFLKEKIHGVYLQPKAKRKLGRNAPLLMRMICISIMIILIIRSLQNATNLLS